MTKAATAEVRASLRGIVETVFYSGPTFTAGRIRTPEGALVNFAGKVFAKPNDPVRLEGQWAHHPKYGRQFTVECLGYDLEMDSDGLANFLANHPDVKAIGPAKARLIADHFGAGFDAAIRTQPEAVASVAKVPLESVMALQRIWVANSDFNAAMTYLAGYRIDPPPGHNAGGPVRQPGGAHPRKRSVCAHARDLRVWVQACRQDRPEDGHAQGSAVADPRRDSLLCPGRPG